MAIVDTVGVRYRGWIFAKTEGIALYTAIDRVVRAVGRIVVCVEAAAEESTISSSRWVRTDPKPEWPNTASPWIDSTSPAFAGISDKGNGLGNLANDCIEKITSA